MSNFDVCFSLFLHQCCAEEEKDSDVEEQDEEEHESEEEVVDEEKEWKELQDSVKRDREAMKGEPSESPVVHAPYYPKVPTPL